MPDFARATTDLVAVPAPGSVPTGVSPAPTAGRGLQLDTRGKIPAGLGIGAGAPVTSLPGSPADAQQAILVDSTSAPTYAWLLQWSAAAAKWIFIGGSPAEAEVGTQQNGAAGTAYQDLATVGPQFVVPRAGTYEIVFSASLSAADVGAQVYVSPKLGAAATADADAAQAIVPAAGVAGTAAAIVRSGLAASATIKLQYRSAGAAGAPTAGLRRLAIRPVTVT